MKRVVATILATVAGIVALLDFKSHGQPLTSAGALPSAGVAPTPSTSAPQPTASATPGASTSVAATPKTYLGQAISTRYGVVQVKATVTAQKLTNVAFVQLEAFDGRSQEINSQAAPILLQETIQAGNAKIQTVSGATYTSDGYIQSLQSALDAAGLR